MPIIRPDYFENGVYHIFNRGVARLPTFLNDDDYHDFLDILRYLLVGFPISKKVLNLPMPVGEDKPHLPVTYKADPQGNGLFRSLIHVLASCLMPNHFHLLVQLKQIEGRLKLGHGRLRTFYPIPEFMKRLCITYAHKFNYRHQREGAILQGRYKIKHIPEDRDVIQVSRYIHTNPSPELVQKPEQWKFSDYHVYINPGSLSSSQFTQPDLIRSYFGGDPNEYRDFVEAGLSEKEAKRIAKYLIDVED